MKWITHLIQCWWNDRLVRCSSCWGRRPRIDYIKRKATNGKFEFICSLCIEQERKDDIARTSVYNSIADKSRRKAEETRKTCFNCGKRLRDYKFYCGNCYDSLVSDVHAADRAYKKLLEKLESVNGLEGKN